MSAMVCRHTGQKTHTPNFSTPLLKSVAKSTDFVYCERPYLGQKIEVSLGKQSIWCINGNFTLGFHYILISFNCHSQRYTSFPYPHLNIHWFFYIVCMAQYIAVAN